MAKNTRKKMKKMYSKKMLKSNKKNNNKYTRRPHQTRKKVFRGGGLGFPISLDKLNTGKYKLVKDFLGSYQGIWGELKLRKKIIEGNTSIKPHDDGLNYNITYNGGRITDIFSQNPHTRFTTPVAIVPVDTICSPASNQQNGGAPDDGVTLQNQPQNQSVGVGSTRLNKLLNRPLILMGTNSHSESPPPQPNVNEETVKELIQRLQPEFIRGSTRNHLVGAIRKNEKIDASPTAATPAAAAAAPAPTDAAPAAPAVDDDALLLEKLENVTSLPDPSPANYDILTSLSDTFDVESISVRKYDMDHNMEPDVDPADDAAAAADAAIPADAAPIEWKPLEQAAVSIDDMTLPAVISESKIPSAPSQPKEFTIEELDALNARLRSKLPPTIDPTFLFGEIAKFKARLLVDEKFAATVWLARIIKDNIALPGSSSKHIEDLFVFRLSTFPSGEKPIYDEETNQTFVYPAVLIVRCRLDRIPRAIYMFDKYSEFVTHTIKISKIYGVKNGQHDWTWRLVNIYKLEDGEKWRSRNEKHMKEQKTEINKQPFPMVEGQPKAPPSPLNIEAKKTLIQFVVYRDDSQIRHLPNPLLGLLRSEKYQIDNYYATRFGLNLNENPIMYGIRALNAIAFSNHRGFQYESSIAKEVKSILWEWYHRKELKEKKQIPSGPVWGDQYHTFPLRTAGAGYSGGSKTAKFRKSRSNKRTIKRSRS
jgi:hypothetical protein